MAFDSPSESNLTLNTTTHHHGHDSHADAPLPIFFIFFALLVGMMCKRVLSALPVPYTCMMLIMGLLMGMLTKATEQEDLEELFHPMGDDVGKPKFKLVGDFARGTRYVADMDPHVMLFIFLPPLIFESAFSIETHMFKKTGSQSMIVATVGMLISALLTALITSFLYPSWSWNLLCVFGAVMSATDPVAVVALLKEMGAPPTLGAFIEGESLLNDGTAVVMFNIFHAAARAGRVEESTFELVALVFQMAVLGPVLGVLIGALFVHWLSRIFNDPMVEITATVTASYLTFFVAEKWCSSSGVLAVVFLGLYFGWLGRTSISPEVEHFLHEFWELLGYLANTVIFILTGVIIALNLFSNEEHSFLTWKDVGFALLLYVSLTLVRLFSLLVCFPLLRRMGYGLKLQDVLVAVWGGLRGAVGLALALVVFLDPILAETEGAHAFRYEEDLGPLSDADAAGVGESSAWETSWLEREMHETRVNYTVAHAVLVGRVSALGKNATALVLLHCSCMVMLTLIVNATTMKWVLSKLGMDKVDHSKEMVFSIAMDDIEVAGKREEQILKMDPVYSCARWPDVRHYKFKVPKIKVRFFKKNVRIEVIERKEVNEARRRFLVAVKSSYWNQFRDGLVSRSSVRELIEYTDRSLDTMDDKDEWNNVHSLLSVSHTSHIAHKFLLVPGFRRLTKYFLFLRLQHGYDCVVSFVKAREEALELMTKVLDSEELFNAIRAKANTDIAAAKKSLFDVHRVLPEIATSIATNAAARTVLNAQRHAVSHLFHDGLLDVNEAKRVNHAIEKQMKRLLHAPPSMQLPDKSQLLGEVSWLSSLDTPSKQVLLEKAEECFYEEGDYIVKARDHGDDVFVIARGTVQVLLEEVIPLEIGGELAGKKHTVLVDELGVGQFIGEMGWVTGQPRFASVRASSPVICFCLRGSALRQVVKIAPVIERELWHVAGCRLAENLFATRPPFNYWNRRDLRKWIYSKWELMSTKKPTSAVFVKPLVLIHGTVEARDVDSHGRAFVRFSVDKGAQREWLKERGDHSDSVSTADEDGKKANEESQHGVLGMDAWFGV